MRGWWMRMFAGLVGRETWRGGVSDARPQELTGQGYFGLLHTVTQIPIHFSFFVVPIALIIHISNMLIQKKGKEGLARFTSYSSEALQSTQFAEVRPVPCRNCPNNSKVAGRKEDTYLPNSKVQKKRGGGSHR
ncbi:hypothetical protein L873DRAFT_1382335 [Choiromyces venosus 120613-1]|uniref:Uncharacterized protein n=1 Tax=Choiromyces venosus 120613-1 TaxID=1336337 RepID=A0A3N4J9R8_9PEZI|nr:hypothetical protein L873DRAFT_1382335 [Choiromyces venosus 120613-1]